MDVGANIHIDSLLYRLCRHQPLISTTGKMLLRQHPVQMRDIHTGQAGLTSARIVSIDNGNDAFKGAMMHLREPFLRTKRIVTAYVPAREVRAGEGVVTWQVNDSEAFWIGDDAISARQSESLPIGFTEERLPDERYQDFLFASLVELLIEAGYTTQPGEFQGVHDLYASFGVPNEEMTLQGAKDSVKRALRSILNKVFVVRRIDEQGQMTTWHIRLIEISPYPQTFASYVCWYYTLDGTPIETDIVRHVTLDIGGGQCHNCEVELLHQATGRPKLRMSASLLGEGTIAIARAVREAIRARFPSVHLSDAEAQQVLISGVVTIGGRRTRVEEVVQDVVVARSHSLFTHLLPLFQEGQSYLMFTGGGSILLAESLRQLVSTKRASQSFLFVPQEFASLLNAIGGYMLAQATAQRALERVKMSTS